MSFRYGGTDTADLAGVTAILTEWPSMGGLEIEASEIPGHHGRIFGGATRLMTRFEFDVLLEGSTPEQTRDRRDTFVALLDPSRGPRPLTLETDEEWEFPDVLAAEEIRWERMTWDYGAGFKLRGIAALETQREPAAREVEPWSTAITGGGSSYTHDLGNTASYPRIEATADSSIAGASFSIGDFSIEIGDIPAGHTAVLDWDTMSFHLRGESGARIRSLVPDMSTYRRPVLQPGSTYQLSRPDGTAETIFYPNARKL